MPRRRLTAYGLVIRRPRICLKEEEWVELEMIGKRAGASVEACIEMAIIHELRTRREFADTAGRPLSKLARVGVQEAIV